MVTPPVTRRLFLTLTSEVTWFLLRVVCMLLVAAVSPKALGQCVYTWRMKLTRLSAVTIVLLLVQLSRMHVD